MKTFVSPDVLVTNMAQRLKRRVATTAHFKQTSLRKIGSAFFVVAMLGLLTSSSQAATLTFTGATSGDLNNTASNYTENAVPTSTDDVIITASPTNAPTLTADLSINSLTFQNTNGTGNGSSVVSSGGPFTLTLGVGGINAAALTTGTITIGSTTAANGVNIALTTASSAIVVGAGFTSSPTGPVNALTLLNVVSGAGGFTKTGGGLLNLNNANNSYTGGTTINAGVLSFVSGGLSTTGNITFSPTSGFTGQLKFAPGNTDDLSARIKAASTSAYVNIDTNGNDITFANSVAATAKSFRKFGLGTLTLSGANTFVNSDMGSTTPGINGGILKANSNTALGTGTISTLSYGPGPAPTPSGGGASPGQTTGNGTVQVSGGVTLGNAFILAPRPVPTGQVSLESVDGNNILSGTVKIAYITGTGIIIQSDLGSTLTLNGNVGVNTSTGGAYTFALSGEGNGVVNGIISNTNATNINKLTKLGTGTWTLAGNNTYTGATTISGGTLTLNNPTANAIAGGSITVNFGSLRLGASNQIVDTVPMTLAGGTFNTAGFSENTSGATTGLGTLTLSGTINTTTGSDTSTTSNLDFGSGTSVLRFSAFGTGTGTLLVSNYTSGSDQFFIGGTGLTTAQLAQIRFVNPDGTGGQSGTFTAKQDATTGEVTPDFTTSITNTPPGNRYNGLITFPASVTTAEDTNFNLTGATALSVVDPDGTTLRVTLRPRNGRIRFNNTNTAPNFVSGSSTTSVVKIFTGTPGQINAVLSNISFIPVANFNGAASVQITSDDGGVNGGGAVDNDVLNITVTAVNDAPVARSDSGSVTQGQIVTLNVVSNDTDVDGDFLNAAGLSANTTAPLGGSATTITTSNGGTATLTTGTPARVQYTAPAASSGFVGRDSFSYTVSDGQGGTASALVTINVTASGGTPTDATASGQASVKRGTFVFNPGSGHYFQTVTITNTSSTQSLSGPIFLVLQTLTNATLVNQSGTTSGGNPYIQVSTQDIAANGTTSVVLEFNDPTDNFISYTPQVLVNGTPS